MNNTPNNKELEDMLKVTASKLGVSPDQLKQSASNGNLDNLLKNSNVNDEFQKVLNSPEAAKKMLESPQAQALIKLLGKNKN